MSSHSEAFFKKFKNTLRETPNVWDLCSVNVKSYTKLALTTKIFAQHKKAPKKRLSKYLRLRR